SAIVTLTAFSFNRRLSRPLAREDRAPAPATPNLHLAPSSRRPRRVYMAAPQPLAQKSGFSPRAPSPHGTKRHFAAAQQTVAFRAKADIDRTVGSLRTDGR